MNKCMIYLALVLAFGHLPTLCENREDVTALSVEPSLSDVSQAIDMDALLTNDTRNMQELLLIEESNAPTEHYFLTACKIYWAQLVYGGMVRYKRLISWLTGN